MTINTVDGIKWVISLNRAQFKALNKIYRHAGDPSNFMGHGRGDGVSAIRSYVQEIEDGAVKKDSAYYKFQVYAPDDKRADMFGYVHFRSRKGMEEFKEMYFKIKKKSNNLSWFIAGMFWAVAISAVLCVLKI